MGFIAFESGVFTLPLDYYSEQLEQLNGLKRLEQSKTLVVAVFSVDAYPFLAFSDPTYHLEDTGIGVFLLNCAA